MDPKEIAKTIAAELGRAAVEAAITALNGGTLDDSYARAIEYLSDRRLASKKFPDGRYVPPGDPFQ